MLVGLLAAVAFPAGLRAQDAAPPRMEPGDRIRFLAPALHPSFVETDLVVLQGDTLRARSTDESGRLFALPLRDVERIEVRMTRRHTLAGFGIGAGVGLAASAVFLSGTCNSGDSPCDARDYLLGGALFTVPPAVLGTIIGSAVKSESWEPWEPPR